jgi:hypothetical protein
MISMNESGGVLAMNKKTASLLAVLSAAALLAGCAGQEQSANDVQLKQPTAQAQSEQGATTAQTASQGTDMKTALTEPSAPSSPLDQASKPVTATSQDSQPTLKMSVDVQGTKAIVHFKTEHFKLSPEHYSQANVPGEGHIHLFVDGAPTRIAVKEDTYTLTDLAPGVHKLEASLHTNMHQPYNVKDSTDFTVK